MRGEDGNVTFVRHLRHAIGGVAGIVTAAMLINPLASADAQTPPRTAQFWVTLADGSKLLARQADMHFSAGAPIVPTITVDDSARYQTISGIGASMTDSSASLLMRMPTARRKAILSSLFNPTTGIGLSYLRQPVGASDFATSIYSLDDAEPSDPTLAHFSVARDASAVLPAIRAARKLNPRLMLMLSPWSAPYWMKTSGSALGGTLLSSAPQNYADYLTKAVSAYNANGAPVDAITIQNEPSWTPADYPGMTLTVAQEASVADALRGSLDRAGLGRVRLVGNDDNWATAARATELLRASPALSGVAFHCYSGDPSAQTAVHESTGKDIYLSECTGGDWGLGFGGDLDWTVRTLLIDGFRDWARTVTMWNLLLDPQHGPHTGGCTDCRGLMTVDPTTGKSVANPEFYALGQLSKFAQPGAVRVASSDGVQGLRTVAFRNSDGSHALLVLNDSPASVTFAVVSAGQHVRASLPGGGVGTLVW
jgi:glucosylceramidase